MPAGEEFTGGCLMTPILTAAEIHSQFVDEWVLLEDPVADAARAIRGGRVLCHSKDRDEVYREAVARHPARFAILYTGTIPEGTAIVL
jgi:hypothetical protein